MPSRLFRVCVVRCDGGYACHVESLTSSEFDKSPFVYSSTRAALIAGFGFCEPPEGEAANVWRNEHCIAAPPGPLPLEGAIGTLAQSATGAAALAPAAAQHTPCRRVCHPVAPGEG